MNPKPKIVYWGCDLHYLRKSREFAITKENAVAKEVKYWHELEFQLFHQVDVIYYPSQYEIDEILREEPDLPAKALPLYIFDEVSPQDYHPEERDGILFVGGFGHPPNLDGIVWFIEEVLPVARELGCTQTLHIVGSNLPDAVKKLACSNIVVHGFLSDQELTSLYKQVRLAVVPLRFGAGVKGKVVEALQQGLPVVTTSIGAEGLPEPDSVMHIADSVESFAEMVVEVVRHDSDTAAKLERYPAYIRDTFSKKVASQILVEDFGPAQRTQAKSLLV
jgi:glycosyltransferase involved in cell wall biosynthesis